ncbi:MAG: hypothetical protein BAJALOKI1v1_480015 [Promethearchaeota archaeon]|nr:MAG: hypothetical protein BAJALOKI1v1_480015 [Candidatus Lokiarchaeota archaeon]
MKSRNFYILIASVVVGLSIFWLNVYAFIELEIDYNSYIEQQTAPDLTPISIEGSGIKGGKRIVTVSQLKSLTFQQVFNKPFTIMNRYLNQYTIIYSGVSLWSVLDRLDLLTRPAEQLSFQFYAADGYKSPSPLSLVIAKNYTTSVILAYEKNGQPLLDEGPIRSVIEQSVMPEGLFSSQYCVKMLTRIVIQ